MARPREFDRAGALRAAMELFWQHGFEGVSVNDLIRAMNISPPSLYAAFGSKAELYREVLAEYQQRPCAVSTHVMTDDVSLTEGIRRLFHLSIMTVTELSPPAGCMISNGLLAVGPDHGDLAEMTASLRRGLISGLQARFERAVARGELPPETDPPTLARYYSAIIQGISIQAHDGASRTELEGIIELSLAGLP